MYAKKFALNTLSIFLALSCSTSNLFAAELKPGSYTIFDIPDSSAVFPYGINDKGMVTGVYATEKNGSNSYTGFIRSSDGVISTINVSGADETFPLSINNKGVIAGGMHKKSDNPDVIHGFLRMPDGKISTFDVRGATIPRYSFIKINDNNVITGSAENADGIHGYLRYSNGATTLFDVNGAKITKPNNINNAGMIVGCYDINANEYSCSNSSYKSGHGFVRMADGSIITFDVPGAVATNPRFVNEDGVISGSYAVKASLGFNYYGFVRTTDGVITTFSEPSAEGVTIPTGMNNSAAIVANASGTHNGLGASGFMRTADGTSTRFDIPGSDMTIPMGINNGGAIVGFYVSNTSDQRHGFIFESNNNTRNI